MKKEIGPPRGKCVFPLVYGMAHDEPCREGLTLSEIYQQRKNKLILSEKKPTSEKKSISQLSGIQQRADGRGCYIGFPFVAQLDHVDKVFFFLVCMLDFRIKDCIRRNF